MGLLKKLQASNPEDVGDSIDGEFVEVPEEAANPQSTPVDEIADPQFQEKLLELGKAIEEQDSDRIQQVWMNEFIPLLAKSTELSKMMSDLRSAIDKNDQQQIRSIWLHQFIPLYAKNTEPVAEPAVSTTDFPALRPGERFSEPYNRKLYARVTGVAENGSPLPPSYDRESQESVSHSQSNLLAQALSLPFALTSEAGSLVLNGLKAANNKIQGYYVKGRENGHAVLGKQLDTAAGEIVGMADALRQQGMGDLISDMKSVGVPAKDLFPGMLPGGRYQHFSDRFSSLMSNESFAHQYSELENAISDFGFKASQYAQMGVELDRDYSEAVERNLEKISVATEGFIFKKDGFIKHLQELARSISESISNLVNNMLGRLKPQ